MSSQPTSLERDRAQDTSDGVVDDTISQNTMSVRTDRKISAARYSAALAKERTVDADLEYEVDYESTTPPVDDDRSDGEEEEEGEEASDTPMEYADEEKTPTAAVSNATTAQNAEEKKARTAAASATAVSELGEVETPPKPKPTRLGPAVSPSEAAYYGSQDYRLECECCVRFWIPLSVAQIKEWSGYKAKNKPLQPTGLFDISKIEQDDALVARDLLPAARKRFLIDLFFRWRFFDSRKKKTKMSIPDDEIRDRLAQSWHDFIEHCATGGVRQIIRIADESEAAYIKRSRSKGQAVKIHRLCHLAGVRCAAPAEVDCRMCPIRKGETFPRRITRSSADYASLPSWIKEEVKSCRMLLAEEKQKAAAREAASHCHTTSAARHGEEEGALSRSPLRARGYLPKAHGEAATCLPQAGSPTTELGTSASPADLSFSPDRPNERRCARRSSAYRQPSQSKAAGHGGHSKEWRCDCEYYRHNDYIHSLWRNMQDLQVRVQQLEAAAYRAQLSNSFSAASYPSFSQQRQRLDSDSYPGSGNDEHSTGSHKRSRRDHDDMV